MVLKYPEANHWAIHQKGGRHFITENAEWVKKMLKDLRAGIVRTINHPRWNENTLKIEGFVEDPRIDEKRLGTPYTQVIPTIYPQPYKELIEWERKDAEFQKPYVKGNKIDFRRDDKGRYRRQLVAPMDNKSAEYEIDKLIDLPLPKRIEKIEERKKEMEGIMRDSEEKDEVYWFANDLYYRLNEIQDKATKLIKMTRIEQQEYEILFNRLTYGSENIHDFLKTLRYRDKNTGDVVITEKGKGVIENAKKNAETFESSKKCKNCQTELINGEGVKAICMTGQDKYQPNCSEEDMFCDYTCMQRGCNLCETIHNCNYSFDIGEMNNLCGFCKGCKTTMNAETFDAESKYECARCGGHGSLCRGCSGLGADYPEEFGSCTLPEFPCPYCDATGMTASNQKAKEFSRVIGYRLESVGEDILGFSLYPEKMHHSKEKLEKIKANKNKIMAQVANHFGLEPVDIEDNWWTERWEQGREEFIERVKSYNDPEFLEDVMNNPQKWEAEHTVRNLGLGAVAVSALAYFLSRRK